MKVFIVSLLLLLQLLVASAFATPLTITQQSTQRKKCANLIRGKPVLKAFCKIYLSDPKPSTSTVTSFQTTTTTVLPNAATTTVTTTTTTTNTIYTSASLFYPGNAPPHATINVQRRSLNYKTPLPPLLQPYAQVVYDACVDVLYNSHPHPHPKPSITSTVTSTKTETTFLAKPTSTVTTTITATDTATVVQGPVAQASPIAEYEEGDTVGYLRIEGLNSNTFEGYVSTQGRSITTNSGGAHACNGRNNNAHSKPGGTMITAIADAGRDTNNFLTFDGTYLEQFQDFQITQIGPDAASNSRYWGALKDRQFIGTGGCEEYFDANGVDNLWAYDAFDAVQFLKATAISDTTQVFPAGQGYIAINVVGTDNSAVAGASIGGQVTDDLGNAAVPIPDEPGYYALRAEASRSIRSNSVLFYVGPSVERL